MQTNIYINNYIAGEVNRKEVFGYAGVRAPSERDNELLDSVIGEVGEVLGRTALTYVDVSEKNGEIRIGSASAFAPRFSAYLSGTSQAAVFVCTVGQSFDRLVARYRITSSARALMIDALGSERVERIADAVSSAVADYASDIGLCALGRFSPGYGDLPLTLQRDIFRLINPTRYIGVGLSEECIMTPSKSVSAIIGLKEIIK